MNRVRSLRVVLPLAFLLFSLVAAAISMSGGWIERRARLQEEARTDTLHDAAFLAALAEQAPSDRSSLLRDAVARFATDPRTSVAAVIDARGQVLIGSDQRWSQQPVDRLPGFDAARFREARQGRHAVVSSRSNGRYWLAMMSFATPARADQLRGLDRGVVYLLYDLSSEERAARSAVMRERVPELVMLLLAVGLLAYGTQALVTRPLEAMQRAAQRIADGEYEGRVVERGPSEIRGLGQALNRMTARLADNISRLTLQAETLQTLLRERQQMERERDRLISVLEAASDLVAIIDPDGRLLYLNEAGRRMTGCAQTDVAAGNIAQLHPGWAAKLIQYEGIPMAKREGQWQGETALLDAQKQEIPASQIIIRHQDPDGGVQYLSTIVRDMTERKRAERAIRELNAELERRVVLRTQELEVALKELEAFSYSVSHDLRTPLRAIDGFSQLLLEDYAPQLDAHARDYLDRVRSGAQFMGRLIDDLLNLSRVSRIAMQPRLVDLTELAQQVTARLGEAHPERKVQLDIAPDLKGWGDPGLLHILLMNLLGNAWKYTAKAPHSRIEFDVRPVDGASVFRVRDNGVGFDMKFQDKLFGAFQRLHSKEEFEGTGIGLATAARIVRRHGGKIWAEGEIGGGATFYFTLGALKL